MDELKTLRFLKEIEEKDKCTLRGILSCGCGNQLFRVNYQGRRTKGIFAPDIIKKSGALAVEAVCSNCGEKIELYNLKNNKTPDPTMYENFQYKFSGFSVFQIRLSYNYYVEKFKTEKYENIFIDVKNEHSEKWHRIVEE